jgi:hypothetical protein
MAILKKRVDGMKSADLRRKYPLCRAEDRRRADDLNLKEALVLNNRVTLTRERPRLR